MTGADAAPDAAPVVDGRVLAALRALAGQAGIGLYRLESGALLVVRGGWTREVGTVAEASSLLRAAGVPAP